MLFEKKYKTTNPFVPFSSKEYEKRISKLTSREYELFKKILFGSEPLNNKEKEIMVLYKKLEVSSQIELMAKYGKNYYHEMEGNFSSKEKNYNYTKILINQKGRKFMKKKLLVGLITLVICFALVGCGKEETPNNDNNNNSNQQQEEPSNNVGVGKYKVEKGNNSVIVITNNGSGISTTTYYFTNGTISKAELIEEFSSASIAEASYNTMKNEPSIMNSYSDIKLNGKKVILTVKNEVLSAYNTFDFNDFYDLMYSTYEVYMD